MAASGRGQKRGIPATNAVGAEIPDRRPAETPVPLDDHAHQNINTHVDSNRLIGGFGRHRRAMAQNPLTGGPVGWQVTGPGRPRGKTSNDHSIETSSTSTWHHRYHE